MIVKTGDDIAIERQKEVHDNIILNRCEKCNTLDVFSIRHTYRDLEIIVYYLDCKRCLYEWTVIFRKNIQLVVGRNCPSCKSEDTYKLEGFYGLSDTNLIHVRCRECDFDWDIPDED